MIQVEEMRRLWHQSRLAISKAPAVLPGGLIVALAFAVLWPVDHAQAERLDNKKAVFAALDKVTARISRLEIDLDKTKQFGALKITPYVCYTRPPTEPPKTTAFVEVHEVRLDGSETKIFAGWMFAQSPGLNAVEHPVFDVWLTDCAGADTPIVTENTPAPPKRKRRRKRRKR